MRERTSSLVLKIFSFSISLFLLLLSFGAFSYEDWPFLLVIGHLEDFFASILTISLISEKMDRENE